MSLWIKFSNVEVRKYCHFQTSIIVNSLQGFNTSSLGSQDWREHLEHWWEIWWKCGVRTSNFAKPT